MLTALHEFTVYGEKFAVTDGIVLNAGDFVATHITTGFAFPGIVGWSVKEVTNLVKQKAKQIGRAKFTKGIRIAKNSIRRYENYRMSSKFP